jgi:hypothetical protein
MKLSEFKMLLERHSQHIPEYSDPEVVIPVKMPYATVGGTPCISVKAMSKGSDWDNGKFMLYPEEKLSKPDADFHKQFKDLQDKYGWVEYENRNLKGEIKKLQKQIADLTKDKTDV